MIGHWISAGNTTYRAVEQFQFSKRNSRIIEIFLSDLFNNIISQIQFDYIVIKHRAQGSTDRLMIKPWSQFLLFMDFETKGF